jgi:hypothetical protein
VNVRHLVLFASKTFTSARLLYQIHPAFLHSGFFNHLRFGYVGD